MSTEELKNLKIKIEEYNNLCVEGSKLIDRRIELQKEIHECFFETDLMKLCMSMDVKGYAVFPRNIIYEMLNKILI